ncbi:Trm112 family protein [Nitrospira sp. BLG_2]|uniref:Trm112 family protein n=1 Tax=Nitrospira sp. BLG_2 TaxID=3397507 RepID=UPI003B99A25C
MSLDKELLAILCCPATKQAVSLAEESLIQKLNAAVARGELKNLGKRPVSVELDGGLIRADRKILYPVRDNIPVMLIEEGIPLEQID